MKTLCRFALLIISLTASGFCALPDAVYVERSMTTAGKNAVMPSSGTPFGNYARSRHLMATIFLGVKEVRVENFRLSQLPDGVLATTSMSTAGKVVVVDSTGTSFNHFTSSYRLVVKGLPNFIQIIFSSPLK